MMNTKNIKHRVLHWVVIIAALAGLAACAGSPTQESTGEYLDDTAITTRVKSAFVSDKEVSAMNITVETFKGTVQLSGFAKNAKEADKAESIARSIKGVKGVKNDIRIK
jgi:osmotically-inducible protein OsmY